MEQTAYFTKSIYIYICIFYTGYTNEYVNTYLTWNTEQAAY